MARDGHPLLLATRKLRWKVVEPLGQTDQGQGVFGRHGAGHQVGHQLHVLAHRQTGHEVVKLEHEAHMFAPITRERRIVGFAQVMVGKPGVAAAGPVQPAQDVEQRGLAAARRPEQHDEFAGQYPQVHILQGDDVLMTGAVALAQVLGHQHGGVFALGQHRRGVGGRGLQHGHGAC